MLSAAETQQADVVFEADCTLAKGATFACVGRKVDYDISGDFDASFHRMTLQVDRTVDGESRPCTLTAVPTG